MALILVFDFTVKLITGFFFLVASANFTTYLALMYVLRNQETPEGPIMKQKTRPFFIFMNCVYFSLIPLAFIPLTAPNCDSIRRYPPSMLYLNFIFLMNTVFFYWIKKHNFFQGEKHESNWKSSLLGTDISTTQKNREMFNEQIQSYNKYLNILSVIQVVIIWLVVRYIDGGCALACDANGTQWLYLGVGGELFIMGMMITIMMQSVMVEKFLYRIPNKHGQFDTIKVSKRRFRRNKLRVEADAEEPISVAVN